MKQRGRMIGRFETQIAVTTLTQVAAASGNSLTLSHGDSAQSGRAELLTIAHLHQSFVMPVFQLFNGGAINRSRLSTNGGTGPNGTASSRVRRVEADLALS